METSNDGAPATWDLLKARGWVKALITDSQRSSRDTRIDLEVAAQVFIGQLLGPATTLSEAQKGRRFLLSSGGLREHLIRTVAASWQARIDANPQDWPRDETIDELTLDALCVVGPQDADASLMLEDFLRAYPSDPEARLKLKPPELRSLFADHLREKGEDLDVRLRKFFRDGLDRARRTLDQKGEHAQ